MSRETMIDGERVLDLGNGRLIRPDRFISSSVEGHEFTEAADHETELPAATDDDVRALFHPDLVASAGIPPKA